MPLVLQVSPCVLITVPSAVPTAAFASVALEHQVLAVNSPTLKLLAQHV